MARYYNKHCIPTPIMTYVQVIKQETTLVLSNIRELDRVSSIR